MIRKLFVGTVLALALSACSHSDRTLPFFTPDGEQQQMTFSASGDGTQAWVTIAPIHSTQAQASDRTLLLQTLNGRKIMLRLNGQNQALDRDVPHNIRQLEFYELGQGGFVDAYRIERDDLCRRFARNDLLNVRHAVTFYQQNAQGQPHMFGVISEFNLKDKQNPAHVRVSRSIPDSRRDYSELLHGSARKLHSFLDNVICHQY
ncbi:hypothetical protein A1D23_10200 [Chelonobacter oris]|uniref:hypothetical protein n=1 Tax=Chelonobacter oris TaxID=505317 RepID=UPI00244CF23B|nr:hypothetical protein [Chelonobacter oris]MDH3000779.1 hypothetical protein [Chelonobacter oris]